MIKFSTGALVAIENRSLELVQAVIDFTRQRTPPSVSVSHGGSSGPAAYSISRGYVLNKVLIVSPRCFKSTLTVLFCAKGSHMSINSSFPLFQILYFPRSLSLTA